MSQYTTPFPPQSRVQSGAEAHHAQTGGAKPAKRHRTSMVQREADDVRYARVIRLNAFLASHYITNEDISEQLATACEPDQKMSAQRASYLLRSGTTMHANFRNKLLDIGFPADVLPPERTPRTPRFPGLENKTTQKNQ